MKNPFKKKRSKTDKALRALGAVATGAAYVGLGVAEVHADIRAEERARVLAAERLRRWPSEPLVITRTVHVEVPVVVPVFLTPVEQLRADMATEGYDSARMTALRRWTRTTPAHTRLSGRDVTIISASFTYTHNRERAIELLAPFCT
jgi:hypothetical protein